MADGLRLMGGIGGAEYNDGRFALRCAAVLGAALWACGLIVLGGVAAPAIFDTLAARGAADARALAGAVFGETLRRFHLLSYACAGVILASLLARGVLGPRPPSFGVRVSLAIVMLGTALYSGVILTAQIERARIEAGGAPSALREGDPRRTRFGRLHALSTVLQIVPAVGGLALMFWELKE